MKAVEPYHPRLKRIVVSALLRGSHVCCATLFCLAALTACIGPIKPVPTQQSQEVSPKPTETAEAPTSVEPAPSDAPPSVPSAPAEPLPPISPQDRGEMPVVEASPVLVDSTRHSYKVDHATTATRTDTPIMETPVSIQVVPQQVLRDQQAVRLDQALKNVSGVAFFPRSLEGSDQYMIRGFETASYYRNGVLRPGNNLVEMANVEQVELLKGPASILYGRADPGGIINIVTKQPLATPYYSLQQQFGSYNFYRTTGDATGPLSQDKSVLYRFNMSYENAESFRDYVDRKSVFLAPTVKWIVSPHTQITAEMEYQNLHATTDPMLRPMAGGTRPPPIPISRFLGEPSWNAVNNERYFGGLTFSHEFNQDWKLIDRLSGEFIHDLGGKGVIPFTPIAADGTVNRYAYEIPRGGQTNRYQNSLNLVGNVMTGMLKHTLLLGYDYFYETDKFTATSYGEDFFLNAFNPVYMTSPPVFDPANGFPSGGSSRSWHGVYLQDQVKLPLNLHVLAGLRYDDATTQNQLNGETRGDHRLSPRVGLLWEARPWLSLYGSYTENFGLSQTFTSDRQPLPPQTAQQWETGVKTEFFDGRLRTTVAYFQLTKQNIAVPDPANPLFFRAIGEAETRGIELDISGEILPGWSVIANYTYMPFAKITKDVGQILDINGDPIGTDSGTQGKRLFNAAKDMGSLWSTYAFQDDELQGMKLRGLKVGAGLQAAGERQGNTANSYQLPGYVIANAMASYEWHLGMTKMTAQLNVSNLFDTTYYAGTNSFLGIMPGTPRFFMGSIRMEF